MEVNEEVKSQDEKSSAPCWYPCAWNIASKRCKIEIIPTISRVFILKKYPALSNIFGLVSGSYVYSQESTSFKLMRHSESLIGFYYCIISLKAKTETLLYHYNDLRTKKIKLFKTKIE